MSSETVSDIKIVVTNSNGKAESQAKLILLTRKNTLSLFITHLYNQVIVVNDADRLEAKITGKPHPDVTYYNLAPHIDELQDVEVLYGSPARIKAKITGFPKPDVK